MAYKIQTIVDCPQAGHQFEEMITPRAWMDLGALEKQMYNLENHLTSGENLGPVHRGELAGKLEIGGQLDMASGPPVVQKFAADYVLGIA